MKTQKSNILLVDDDSSLCELLAEYLSQEGLNVKAVNSGKAALDQLNEANTKYHAVVLDIMMPGMSGIEVLQQLRPQNNIPVIMLTGKGDDIDRILGLEMGADDYLGKPCNPRELLARIRAVLRRTQAQSTTITDEPNNPLTLFNLKVDVTTFTALVGDKALDLTTAEFNTLQLLMRSPGQTLSKQTLTEQVLKRKLEAHDRSIDVHISRLRQKLSNHGLDQIIKSIRGVGYQMLTGSPSNE